ncbi:MAG: T9SS type A sorting domain-containing protein, partial [Bacteroides sp.]
TLVKKGTDICSRDKVNQKISIYPIPAKETISINGNGKEGIWTAQVFASNGTLVMSQQINFSYKPIINISSLTSGIYYLRLSNNEEVNTLKIIKE